MTRWSIRATVLSVSLLALLALTSGRALADYGSYTDGNGVPCTYSGSGSMYVTTCSGMTMPSGQFVSYSCTYTFWSRTNYSWNCQSVDGATWSGSR